MVERHRGSQTVSPAGGGVWTEPTQGFEPRKSRLQVEPMNHPWSVGKVKIRTRLIRAANRHMEHQRQDSCRIQQSTRNGMFDLFTHLLSFPTSV